MSESGVARLERLLRPRSLAFIGGEEAELAIDACAMMGFTGDMWGVNPHRPLRDIPTVERVTDIPAPVDAAFLGVNRHIAMEIVRDLAAVGTGAVVCYASGFAEIGEPGEALQDQLIAAAGGMPVLGPNCYGTLSAVTGAALWPDLHGLTRCERGVALISQSGNIAVNLTMARRGLDIAYLVTVGNQADVGLSEVFEAVVADTAVTGVGIYAEAVDDISRFVAAACEARRRGLPTVVLKAGESDASRAIAVTHTGSLVGSDTAYDALFRRFGVRRVRSVDELLDTLAVVGKIGPLPGNRLVSLSCSGGEAAMVADRSGDYDVSFPALAHEHRDRVATSLDGRVAVNNPLDYHTFIWGDEPRLTDCFNTVLSGIPTQQDGRPAEQPFDAAMLILDLPAGGLDRSRWWPTLRAFGMACSASQTPGVLVATMSENLPDEARSRAAEFGLASCAGIDSALAALEAAAQFGQWLQRPHSPTALLPPSSVTLLPADRSPTKRSSTGPPLDRSSVKRSSTGPPLDRSSVKRSSTGPPLDRSSVKRSSVSPPCDPSPVKRSPAGSLRGRSVVTLSEFEAKKMLAATGIAVPPGVLIEADDAVVDGAVAAAAEMGYPVVVKASGVAHKAAVDGVFAKLANPDEVATAAEKCIRAGDGSVLVEAFIAGTGAELLVSVRSEQPIGMLLTLGAGGTFVELFDDTASLLLPADADEIREALRQLRIWPLLSGAEGGPAAVDAVVSTIETLDLLVRHDRSIAEIEINPLLITSESAVAVDALIVMVGPAADTVRSACRGNRPVLV